MKFQKVISVIVSCVLISGCQSKVVVYTSEDAMDYALEKANTTQAKLIGVKQKDGDTIWTFQESYDRALTWQTIDHHYTDSFSINEVNELVSNYDTKVIAYYFAMYASDFAGEVSLSYTYLDSFPFSAIIEIPFETREDLQQGYEDVVRFLEQIENENLNYTDQKKEFDVQADFIRDEHVFHFNSASDSYAQLEEAYLRDAIIYQDTQALSEFEEDAILEYEKSLDSRIYLKNEESDEWQETDYFTFDHELKISSAAFYDLLQELNVEDITINGERSSYTITNKETEYGPYEEDMISFYEVERITGLQLKSEWQINEVNDEDAKKEVG